MALQNRHEFRPRSRVTRMIHDAALVIALIVGLGVLHGQGLLHQGQVSAAHGEVAGLVGDGDPGQGPGLFFQLGEGRFPVEFCENAEVDRDRARQAEGLAEVDVRGPGRVDERRGHERRLEEHVDDDGEAGGAAAGVQGRARELTRVLVESHRVDAKADLKDGGKWQELVLPAAAAQLYNL